jgi:hypothetical protein
MANNVLQVKRTSTTGRTPNTTASYATNSQYIAAGEFALNMADGILYTSNGSAVIEVGANLVNQKITGTLSVTNAIASGNATSGAVQVTGGIGVANNVYVGGRIGFSNSTNISVVYQFYNSTTGSLDTVFG